MSMGTNNPSHAIINVFGRVLPLNFRRPSLGDCHILPTTVWQAALLTNSGNTESLIDFIFTFTLFNLI